MNEMFVCLLADFFVLTVSARRLPCDCNPRFIVIVVVVSLIPLQYLMRNVVNG
jgi:hypothetical protein